MIRYRHGERYALHYDNSEAQRASAPPLPRAATLIVYLREPGGGGHTHFPDARPAAAVAAAHGGAAAAGGGVRVAPRVGRAVVFWSARADGGMDANCMHAAQPVRGGEKWIATRWFAEA